jgi:hypothetical protein
MHAKILHKNCLDSNLKKTKNKSWRQNLRQRQERGSYSDIKKDYSWNLDQELTGSTQQ